MNQRKANYSMFSIQKRRKVFCAFCRLKFSVYKNKHIGLIEALSCGAIATIANYFLFGDFHPLMIAVVISLLMFAELQSQLRWRSSLLCPHCHFDPVLYKRSPSAASIKVKAFLDLRKQDPHFLLKPAPKLKPLKRKSSLSDRSKNSSKRSRSEAEL